MHEACGGDPAGGTGKTRPCICHVVSGAARVLTIFFSENMVPFKSVSLDTKSIKFMKSYSFVVWLVTAAVVLALVKTLAGSSQQPQPLIPPPTGSLPRMSMATNNSINWTAAWSEHYFAEIPLFRESFRDNGS